MLMARSASNKSGGFSKDNTVIIIEWRTKKGTVIGSSVWVITMTKLTNGFCMDFSLDRVMDYSELQVTSNFSFLRGASHPEEIVEHAALLGYKSIAITDRNTFAGIVRGHAAAKKSGIRFIPSCRLDLIDGISLLAYPTDIGAYSRLSNLLSVGNLRIEKGKCELYKSDVYEHSQGLKFIAVPPSTLNKTFEFESSFIKQLTEYREVFGDNLYITASRSYRGSDSKLLYRIFELAKKLNISSVATND